MKIGRELELEVKYSCSFYLQSSENQPLLLAFEDILDLENIVCTIVNKINMSYMKIGRQLELERE
jgi:hypothetical protein